MNFLKTKSAVVVWILVERQPRPDVDEICRNRRGIDVIPNGGRKHYHCRKDIIVRRPTVFNEKKPWDILGNRDQFTELSAK